MTLMGTVTFGKASYSGFIQAEKCVKDSVFQSKLEGPLTQHHREQHERTGSTSKALLREHDKNVPAKKPSCK